MISRNDGATWQTIPGSGVGGQFECATFLDANRAWAVNHQGQVFTTNSAGTYWTKSASLKDFTGAKQIELLNENDGWILEFLGIWHTEDGGVTWHESLTVLTPGVKGQPTRIYPVDTKTLVVSGTEGQVYLTKDGGATWKIQTLASDADLRDISFPDKQTGWICGLRSGDSSSPVLFQTKDGGDSWTEMASTENGMISSSIWFVDRNEGWLAGHRRVKNDQSVPLKGVLLHTTDGGGHWSAIEIGSNDPFFSIVRFTDKKHGWLAGRDNLYRTADGGSSWQLVLKLPPIKDP